MRSCVIQLAYFLRRQPYQVNLILGGVDGEVPSIYFIDYLGTMKKMDYCAHGYPSYILLSLFDRLWKVWAAENPNVQKDMTREEAVDLANRCMDEMKNRFPMNEHHYITKIVSKEGIEVTKCCVVCWLERVVWWL